MRFNLPGISTRWAAGLVGCALAALGLTASLLHLRAADPLVIGLAVSAAVWLAWVAFDFALAPVRAADAQARQRQSGEAAGAHPAFADTQASWWSP